MGAKSFKCRSSYKNRPLEHFLKTNQVQASKDTTLLSSYTYPPTTFGGRQDEQPRNNTGKTPRRSRRLGNRRLCAQPRNPHWGKIRLQDRPSIRHSSSLCREHSSFRPHVW